MKAANLKIERIDEGIMSSLSRYTFPQILSKQAERFGSDRIAIREKAYGIWQTYNWQEYLRYTRLVCLGLIALGLKRGENVGLILDNHPEWLFSELGAQSVGAITVNLFTSSVAKELVYGLNRIEASYVFAQDQEQVDKLLECREKLPHVRKIIYVDPTGMRSYRDDTWLLSFRQLLEIGRDLDKREAGLFERTVWEGKPKDVALMLMTSGTTGLPKLVMLSFGNFTDMARKWLETAPHRHWRQLDFHYPAGMDR